MYINKVTFVIATLYLHQICGIELSPNNVETQEVEVGNSVILQCKSNDDLHNFMFWHLSNTDKVIGPRNEFNINKYKFEILSGNLTIRAVTSDEAGLYTCVSDGVEKSDISAHSVNLVLKDWHNSKEQDSIILPKNTNSGDLWKVSATLGCIFIFLVIIAVALHIYHKEIERPKYFDIIKQNDDDDEDSTEELFTREPSTSGTKTVRNKNGTSDNFQKVYTSINIKDT